MHWLRNVAIKQASSVNWEEHTIPATQYVLSCVGTGVYGNITSLRLRQHPDGVVAHITWMDTPEVTAKPLPEELLVPLADGSVVRIKTAISRRGLATLYISQGSDVMTNDSMCPPPPPPCPHYSSFSYL